MKLDHENGLVAELAAQDYEQSFTELDDMQLALVGGGVGEVVIA